MAQRTDAQRAAVVARFLGQLLADRQRGIERSLQDYQRSYPGHEALIAAEFARSAGDDAGAGAHGEAGTGAMVRGAAAARYQQEEEVARGGMGTIYRIHDPGLGRQLAKKVLAGDVAAQGPDSPLVRRFLEEAHVTAQLEHPGIVPIHELGIDAQGRAYFTMPLVQGRNFKEIIDLVHEGRDDWNRTRALGVLQRVCEAVAYAHSKGIVHRDLKPANVMVGQFGETYVMDWGLARVLGGRARTGTADAPDPPASIDGIASSLTMAGDVVGTPAYMAPEQARGELQAIGPRSDVFAVGAMLYHLLTGRAPYQDSGSTTWQQLLEAALAGPPTPVREAAVAVPEELAAICDRAMARDPALRYPSVLELGDDLRAFLEDRVVRAHRTGALAEFGKWVKRNRLAAAAAGLAAVSLIAGIGASLWLKQVADDNAGQSLAAKDAAELQLGIRKAVLDFLNKDLLAAVAPGRVGRNASMREVVDAAATRIEGRFPDRPIVEAAVRTTLGDTYRRLGETDKAEHHLLRAVALHAAHSEPIAAESIEARRVLAIVYRDQGRLRDAARLGREILAIARRAHGPTHDDTLTNANNLGLVLTDLGEYAEAEQVLREVFEVRRKKLGPDHDHTLVSMSNLGLLYYDWGRHSEAEPLIRGELETCVRKHGEEDPGSLASMNNYANLLCSMKRYDEGLQQHERIAAISARVRGATHHETLKSMWNRAAVLHLTGRLAEATAALAELQRGAAGLDPEHPIHIMADLLGVRLQLRLGDPSGALLGLDDLLPRCQRVLGDRSQNTLDAQRLRAEALHALQRTQEALHGLAAALAGSEDADSQHLCELRILRGKLLTEVGSLAEAEVELLRAERFLSASTPQDARHGETVRALVELYERAGQPEQAARWRRPE